MFQVLKYAQHARKENKFGWEFKESDNEYKSLHIVNGVMHANWSDDGF